jgi:phosphotransferase system enzyme I (PtsI)
MKVYNGNNIVNGIVISKILIYKKNNIQIQKVYIENVDKEVSRLLDAIELVKNELNNSYEYALKELSEDEALIFKVQETLLEDEDYIDKITSLIKKDKINAEFAIHKITDDLIEQFKAIPDSYMQERCVDIKENSKRIVNLLGNQNNDAIKIEEPVILIAEDILATDVIHFNKAFVKGVILQKGTSTSHASILIKNKNIPYIINSDIPIDEEFNNKPIIMDGKSIYIDPDELFTKRILKKQKEVQQELDLLKEYIGKEDITLDGKKINLYCNIGNVNDVNSVLENDAQGIGLFRSEFLFIEKDNYPTEQEQYLAYKEIVQKMDGKKVIIRTIDIGSDKDADYFNLEKEENPALGYRAIRICLDRPELFKTQLRAIYRASKYGKVAIMFPMIISEDEIFEIKNIIQEVKQELLNEGIEFDNDVELGIMIETPAAVAISDILAKYVDFFSIGSNDLTQYTLAIDRQNLKLNKKYNVHNKAILRMIYTVIENAHENNIWVGMCGELASDLDLIELFLCMGIDELSVSPNSILKIREIIRSFNIEENKRKFLKDYGRKDLLW